MAHAGNECEDLAETAAHRTHVEILRSTVHESTLYGVSIQSHAREARGPASETLIESENRTT